jgi:hypothetical protein
VAVERGRHHARGVGDPAQAEPIEADPGLHLVKRGVEQRLAGVLAALGLGATLGRRRSRVAGVARV